MAVAADKVETADVAAHRYAKLNNWFWTVSYQLNTGPQKKFELYIPG